jgi:energy-converting hydrogenase Eha subunit G
VCGAVVGENLTPIREYLSTVKNRQKCATVYRRVVVKGLSIFFLMPENHFFCAMLKGLGLAMLN